MFTRYPLIEQIPSLGAVTFRKNIRAKRIRISVKGPGEVVVTVPRFGSFARARAFLQAREPWIHNVNKKFVQKKVISKLSTKSEVEVQRRFCQKVVQPRVEKLAVLHDFTYRHVRMKNMISRWGSCSRKKNLNFSIYLVELPDHLIQYIVAHELCHTVEMNHGPRFWNLLEKVYPGARKADREMRKYQMV